MTAPFYVPPEQLIKDRAEFARKGIQRGRPIVVIEYEKGILLIGENPSRSLHKIAEIYDHLAFAAVGRFNEFEMLRVAGIRYADVKGFAYARADVTGKGLANAYSQTVGQIFTHEVKPYEVEVIVAEIGKENHIYHVRFDGTLRDEHGFAVIGGAEDAIRERMAETYEPDLELAAAMSTAVSAIAEGSEEDISDVAWEAAVLDANLGRRKFRRLNPEEISTAG
ncbi:MAG: proteasome subunit alpha [Acidimicrobiia bacterium]|nr:MAG: proteasome subunit alpha [Acidimicrobiia bacterium]